MKLIALRNARLLDPVAGSERRGDLLVGGGQICAATPSGDIVKELDLAGRLLAPGLTDLSARLGEPGAEHKATIASETRAAVRNGVTTLCVPPDTDPVIDEAATVELIHRRAEDAGQARVVPLGALTAGLRGEQLSEMASLRAAGCVGMSNAARPLADTRVLRRAMEYAATFDIALFLHPLDPWLADGGCAHEGPVAARLGLPGIPVAAETVALARLLELVAQTRARVHFQRLSSARAVDMIARAKDEGLPVTADVSINHLHLSEHDLLGFNSYCHLLPPLRSRRDLDALRRGVAGGVIDAICSDHQPHDPDAKLAPFPATEAGASGLDTWLSLVLKLVEEEVLPLAAAWAAASSNPARILGLPGADLRPGSPADLCVIDVQAHWQVSADTLFSAGKNSPYLGWELPGRVTQCLVGGRLFDYTGG